jgi:hypothetical protein
MNRASFCPIPLLPPIAPWEIPPTLVLSKDRAVLSPENKPMMPSAPLLLALRRTAWVRLPERIPAFPPALPLPGC